MHTEQETEALTALANLVAKFSKELDAMDLSTSLDDVLIYGQKRLEEMEEFRADGQLSAFNTHCPHDATEAR